MKVVEIDTYIICSVLLTSYYHSLHMDYYHTNITITTPIIYTTLTTTTISTFSNIDMIKLIWFFCAMLHNAVFVVMSVTNHSQWSTM